MTTLDRAWIKGRAAASTVEALMHSLRERGVQALAEPSTRQRLAQLSDEQVIEVGSRLRKIAMSWSADEVSTLVKLREDLKR